MTAKELKGLNIEPAKKYDLPAIFTNQERYCYKWLYDCGVKGWLVDMLKKTVVWVDNQDRLHNFDSLVCFAKFLGCKLPPPPKNL